MRRGEESSATAFCGISGVERSSSGILPVTSMFFIALQNC